MMQPRSNFITTSQELHDAVKAARAANLWKEYKGLPGRYLSLPKPVRMNWGVNSAGGEIDGKYQPPDLREIDLSGFLITGDFSGANLANAKFDDSFIVRANFGVVDVVENSTAYDTIMGGFSPNWLQPGFDEKRVYSTHLENASFIKAHIYSSSLNGAVANSAKFGGAILRTTSLNNADFSYSDLRGTDFGNCDTRTLILTGTQRDHKDPLIDTRGAVDIYLTFVSAGAIAALIAHSLHAIKVPHGIAATVAIYTGLLLILYMIVWNVLWLRGKSHSPPHLGTSLLVLLTLEAILAYFQLAFDPLGERFPPWIYLVLAWIICFVSFFTVRTIRYPRLYQLKHLISWRHYWFRPDSDTLAFLAVPILYTLTYLAVLWMGSSDELIPTHIDKEPKAITTKAGQ